MRTLIVEDEKLSAQRLEKLVYQADSTIQVEALLSGVAPAVDWLNTHAHPDFLLLDIQLGDGLSFEILEQTGVCCPVIFTTAFNEYAVKAFRMNSIDYLLKPIDLDELVTALGRVKDRLAMGAPLPDHGQMAIALQMLTRKYKERFVIRVGDKIHLVAVAQIAAFVSMEGETFAVVREGRLYDLDLTLDQLSQIIDPQKFFRISRKYIVAIDAIEGVTVYGGSRLRLYVKGIKSDEVLVSRERVSEFREWMDQ